MRKAFTILVVTVLTTGCFLWNQKPIDCKWDYRTNQCEDWNRFPMPSPTMYGSASPSASASHK